MREWLVCEVGVKQLVWQTIALSGEGIGKLSLFDSCYKLLIIPFFQTAASNSSLLGGAGNRTRVRFAFKPQRHEPHQQIR